MKYKGKISGSDTNFAHYQNHTGGMLWKLQQDICIILKNFNEMLKMKQRGTNLFFTDIDNLKQKMLEEIM